MSAQDSLFSRANPRPIPTKKVRGFLGLPGELRNRIYGYYFQKEFRVELMAKGVILGDKKPKMVKLCFGGPVSARPKETPRTATMTLRVSRKLGQYKRVDGLLTQWDSSLSAIPFVCKQIHSETIGFLYRKTTFVFAAPKRILNFLAAISTRSLVNITKLHLHYSAYGEPKMLPDRVWSAKHRASWAAACRVASKRLDNLQVLEIWIHWSDSNVYMNLHQPFLEPMWQFRRLTCARKGSAAGLPDCASGSLQRVLVHFSTRWSQPQIFQRPEVGKASADMHNQFGIAIERAILGWSAENAMVNVAETWKRHRAWRYHLNFMKTGW
ncbi:hypothetical protein B0J11DRAFT_521748 [Dendryphion nanum]|uniref:DUF7730 domain-containing protein n=1 Tax=Dendryphion nanum TaxID=256645 RepID=A0A9P9E4V6_9PLEO|nr:hypothetical protein B0J11DRAFT_521748 [Dendryphion nanum]